MQLFDINIISSNVFSISGINLLDFESIIIFLISIIIVSAIFAIYLKYSKKNQEHELQRARQEAEILAMSRLQEGMIPSGYHELGPFQLHCRFLPASKVGGDYFDFRFLDDQRLLIAIGDVSGHGLPAGLVVAMAKAGLIASHRYETIHADKIMEALNEIIHRGVSEKGMFMTFCYMIIDPKNEKILFTPNGFPFPLIIRKDKTIEQFTEHGNFPLGVLPQMEYDFIERKLEDGDTIVLYSDGLAEQLNCDDIPWTHIKVKEEVVNNIELENVEEFNNKILDELNEYKGKVKQNDDITVVSIRYKG